MTKAKPEDLIIIRLGLFLQRKSKNKKQTKTGWLVRLWRLKESVLIYIFRLQINKIQGRSGKKKATPDGMAFFFCTKIMQNDKKKILSSPFSTMGDITVSGHTLRVQVHSIAP